MNLDETILNSHKNTAERENEKKTVSCRGIRTKGHTTAVFFVVAHFKRYVFQTPLSLTKRINMIKQSCLLHTEHRTAVLPLPAILGHAHGIEKEGSRPPHEANSTSASPELPVEGTKEILEGEVAHTEPHAVHGTLLHVTEGRLLHVGGEGVLIFRTIPSSPASGGLTEVGLVVSMEANNLAVVEVWGSTLNGNGAGHGASVAVAATCTAKGLCEHSSLVLRVIFKKNKSAKKNKS
jgi:hypothetical protein